MEASHVSSPRVPDEVRGEHSIACLIPPAAFEQGYRGEGVPAHEAIRLLSAPQCRLGVLAESPLEGAHPDQLRAKGLNNVRLAGRARDIVSLDRPLLRCLQVALNQGPDRLELQPRPDEQRLWHGGRERAHVCEAGFGLRPLPGLYADDHVPERRPEAQARVIQARTSSPSSLLARWRSPRVSVPQVAALA